MPNVPSTVTKGLWQSTEKQMVMTWYSWIRWGKFKVVLSAHSQRLFFNLFFIMLNSLTICERTVLQLNNSHYTAVLNELPNFANSKPHNKLYYITMHTDILNSNIIWGRGGGGYIAPLTNQVLYWLQHSCSRPLLYISWTIIA